MNWKPLSVPQEWGGSSVSTPMDGWSKETLGTSDKEKRKNKQRRRHKRQKQKQKQSSTKNNSQDQEGGEPVWKRAKKMDITKDRKEGESQQKEKEGSEQSNRRRKKTRAKKQKETQRKSEKEEEEKEKEKEKVSYSNCASQKKTLNSRKSKALSNLDRVRMKLQGGRFRFLNQQLYETKGHEAFRLFQNEPHLFDEYHEGFRSQVKKWPKNPLEHMKAFLRKLPAKKVVVDFGCGEAELAKTFHSKHQFHSFDLVAKNSFIVACDIANVPLSDDCADVAIFCLSLMGTNFLDFIQEAHRILKPGLFACCGYCCSCISHRSCFPIVSPTSGLMKIAEVTSRIENTDEFVEAVCGFGFELQHKDEKNTHFVLFDFQKAQQSHSSSKPQLETSSTPKPVKLKACQYKKR